mmetsp:Transcript_117487/g.327238  ORF Transcript_117487/g.327238 Transcript_117487/m.327238 type:complete len:112 (-) Transcript_117487:176-511(-)
MAHQRHGKLEGEEHIDYIDKQLQNGAIIRMYQFSMELPGGANGVRFVRGQVTTSLEQARKEREDSLLLRKKKEARISRDASSPHSLSPRSPTSPGAARRSLSGTNPGSAPK